MNSVIIILNYNDGVRSAALAEKICPYSSLGHIILVDNHSTDDSPAVLKQTADRFPDRISVLYADSNGGYARGNNLGIRFALKQFDPEFIFLANPDVFFTDRTASEMINALSEHPEFGLVAPLVRKGRNVWNLPSFAGILEELFLISFNIHKKMIRSRILSSGKKLVPAGVAEGSFFLISKAAFEASGGLDERTFLYGEEIILSFRLRKCGLKTGILPGCFYDHLHSASIKKQYRSSKALAFAHIRRSFRIYNKYYLHTNRFQDLLFESAAFFAWVERVIYDFLMKLKPGS